MTLRAILLLAVVPACAGSTCSVNVNVNSATPLDEATAIINIRRTENQSQATVEAAVTRGFANVELTDEQSIMVNGVELNRTGGLFVASVPAADNYTVSVREPTRGVDTTHIAEPGGFDIVSPPAGGVASLSGFMVEWTDAQAGFLAEVRITQTLLGEPKSLTVGPLADTGSLVITDAQIADGEFGQGATMTLTVTRIAEETDVNGFASGTLRARLTKSITVNAGP